MRATTVITGIMLAVVGMVGPGLVIFRLPLVANWPYVGLGCGMVSVLMGVIYGIMARRRLKRPAVATAAWLAWLFPLWVAVFAVAWSGERMLPEKQLGMVFSDGVVVEKYRSSNHGYLSVRVQVPGRGVMAVEGLSAESWERVKVGGKVEKRLGTRDVVVLGQE